jgi:hypothetical protein
VLWEIDSPSHVTYRSSQKVLDSLHLGSTRALGRDDVQNSFGGPAEHVDPTSAANANSDPAPL